MQITAPDRDSILFFVHFRSKRLDRVQRGKGIFSQKWGEYNRLAFCKSRKEKGTVRVTL